MKKKRCYPLILVLLEAIPAIHRPSFGRLERDIAFLLAFSADRLMHLAWTLIEASVEASAVKISVVPFTESATLIVLSHFLFLLCSI